MTLYVIAGLAIVVASYGVYRALQESDADRARGYPAGSFERRILEGRQ